MNKTRSALDDYPGVTGTCDLLPKDHEDLNPQTISDCVEHAPKGDYRAGLRLLELFCEDVDSGKPPPQTLLAYLAECFKEILVCEEAGEPLIGREVAIALNIARPKHRPLDPEKLARDQSLALQVATRMLAFRASKRKLTHPQHRAFTEVARDNSVEPRLVEAAYQKHKYPLLKHLAGLLQTLSQKSGTSM